jgi:hypothetical protein
VSHTSAVERAGDEMIERFAETDLAVYYRIGLKITVSERTSGGWLCHTCTSQDRYEIGEHKGCAHIQRVKKWAADHPQEQAVAA